MVLSEVVILGAVQGLTEFLPVSSSGHLVVARMLFGISDASGTAFDAFLHLGTLVAVGVYFWKVWWGILRGLFTPPAGGDAEGRDKRELAAKLALATVPGAIVGYGLQNVADAWLRSHTVVGVGFLVTAGALALADIFSRRSISIPRASFGDAFLIGLAQVVALVPGISRSGITIAAGRARGMARKQAAVFSFLMSAPIIAGAGLASLGKLASANSFSFIQLGTGFIVSFVAGMAAIALVLKIVEKVSFWPFVVYLVGLAIMVLSL